MPACLMCHREVPIAPTFTARSPIPVAHATDKGQPCSIRPNDAYDQEVLQLIDQDDQFWPPELQRGSDPASVPQPRGPEGNTDARDALAGSQALTDSPGSAVDGTGDALATTATGSSVAPARDRATPAGSNPAPGTKKTNKKRKPKSDETDVDSWDP